MANEPNSSSSGEDIVSSEESVSESQPDITSTQPPSSTSPHLIKPSIGKRPLAEGDGVDLKRAAKKKLAEGEGVDLKKAAKKKKAVVLAEGDSVDLKKAAKKKKAVVVVLAEGEDGDLNRAAKKKKPAVLAEGDAVDLKRAKKRRVVLAVAAPKADIGGGEKKVLFERLWSEENEINLIQGMINFVEETSKDPFAYVNDFHEFVKKSLNVDVTDKQVLAKLRKLKHKYRNNVAKLEKYGKVRSFSNPHEKKLYEMSKNLWVSETVNAKVKGEVEVVNPKVGQVCLQVTDEGIMNMGLELLSGPKKVEMEEKWKNLKVQELEHFLKKVDILKEQGEVVMNAIKKSGGK